MRPGRIIPPPELSPRVVPLSESRVDIETSRKGDIHAATIHWRNLVLATWQLPAGMQYAGVLPEGMSSQQFWAKVTRAARTLKGEVGVVIRGRCWWVWNKIVGISPDEPKRGPNWIQKTVWPGVRDTGMVVIDGVLDAGEKASVRTGLHRQGISVEFKDEDDCTVVVSRVNLRKALFNGVWEKLEAGKRADIKGQLTKLDVRALREKARRKGFRVGITRDSDNTIVWRV